MQRPPTASFGQGQQRPPTALYGQGQQRLYQDQRRPYQDQQHQSFVFYSDEDRKKHQETSYCNSNLTDRFCRRRKCWRIHFNGTQYVWPEGISLVFNPENQTEFKLIQGGPGCIECYEEGHGEDYGEDYGGDYGGDYGEGYEEKPKPEPENKGSNSQESTIAVDEH
jgi:hypothetical protein